MYNSALSWLGAVALCLAAAGRAGAEATEPSAADAGELEALLNQPVYAASKFAQDAASAPAAVTVLTAGDIRAYGWRTIAEVLNGVRGVYLRYDRFYNYVGVRGFARPGDFSSRLLMLIDGMRVNDNIYGQAGVGREFPLDVGLIERVEFIPGPGSALHGSNAVLGVVNIVTKSAAALAGSSVNVELGSDSSRLVSMATGRELGSARLVLAARAEVRPGQRLYYAEFDAPDTFDGRVGGADRENDRKVYAKWTLADLTATALVSERRKKIPTGAFETVFASRDTHGVDRYAMTDLQWQHRLDATQEVYLRAGLAEYDFEGRFDYAAPYGRQHLDQTGRWGSTEARWQYEGLRHQKLVLGVEAQSNFTQDQRSAFEGTGGGEPVQTDESSHRYGLFASDEIVLGRGLHAVLGARLDRQLSGDHKVTPRIALVWEAAPGLVLKALDGRAYREPNAYESQFEDITAMSNPDLRSETLRATELALDWRALPNLRLAASVYRYKVANLIEQQQDPTTELLVFNNAGTARARGLELEADYIGASGWRARTSWARQSARDDQTRLVLSNSPRSLSKLNLSLPIAPCQARLGLEWQRTGQRRTLDGARLPSHGITNLTVQLAPAASKLAWSASVYNLFDKARSDPGGPELVQDSIEQDGRTWRLQMTLQF